jgi:hypothetical protein
MYDYYSFIDDVTDLEFLEDQLECFKIDRTNLGKSKFSTIPLETKRIALDKAEAHVISRIRQLKEELKLQQKD